VADRRVLKAVTTPMATCKASRWGNHVSYHNKSCYISDRLSALMVCRRHRVRGVSAAML
jgi:hypothetical protein